MSEKIVKTRIWKQNITTEASKILDENPCRKAFRVQNLGTVNVELLFSPKQAYGDGIRIASGGEYINRDSQAAFWLIAESGTQDVRIQEDSY